MADEPRRSVRATKGQHTKSLDLLDQPTDAPKKRGKKSASAKKAASQELTSGADEEEEEIIRCVCGVTEQDDDSDESWIACENCSAWQHNVCMGITTDEEILKNMDYYCEECRPENHKELLDALKRGVKLWETRRAAHEKAQHEAQKVKKGKKGKGKRVSDPKVEPEPNGNGKATPDDRQSTPDTKKEKKDGSGRASSTKRKAMDGSQEDSAKTKVRKVSTPRSKTPLPQSVTPADIPATIDELADKVRQGAAKLLYKNLLGSVKNAQKSGIYQASASEADEKALRLGLEIERAIHDTHQTPAAYKDQARKVSSNLKINQELCDGLLSGSLTPVGLASMTDDDMASEELQRTTAEMKARADKQSIMLTDDGPRVRRTHKGDEVIEQDNFVVPSDETAISRRRSMIDPNQGMGARSREGSVGDGNELPQDIDDYRSQDDIRGNAGLPLPLNVDTKPAPHRKPSQLGDFDINKVFSSVKSPTLGQHTRKPSIQQAPPRNGPGEDADIDRMLSASPEYFPPDDTRDSSIVWQGSLVMNSVADFKANARHIGGADLSTVGTKWHDLVPERLQVAGRIDQEKANEYLCGLRWNPRSDVVVMALESREDDGSEFKKIFDYFYDKKRYGVVGNKNSQNVRDTYLVPVPAGRDGAPEFLMNFPNNKVPEERQEPMLLVALVVREPDQPAPALTTAFSSADSPLMGHPQRQMSIGGYNGPQMSPINHQGSFGSPTSSQHEPIFAEDAERRLRMESQAAAQARGEDVARGILGHLQNAPTVGFLMPQAHVMQPNEWTIIREILVQEPKAQTDLKLLSDLVEKRSAADVPNSVPSGKS